MKTSKQFDNFIFTAFLFTIIGYFIACTFIETKNIDIAKDVIGVLKLILATIVGFKWGSSASSQKKDDTIKAMGSPAPTANIEKADNVTVSKTQDIKDEPI